MSSPEQQPRRSRAVGARVGLWGTFDVDNFGDHLFPRIFEHELSRRLPGVQVTAFSPLGHLHPVPFAGGLHVEPLGAWSPQRLEELAQEYDLIAIGGGEIVHGFDDSYARYYGTSVDEARRLRPGSFFTGGLGPELERAHPVAWHSVGIPFDLEGELADSTRDVLANRAYVTVRDPISRERLERIGVTREIVVVPDSAFLVDRIVTRDQLERRLRYLREIGSYPASDRPLLVQGSRVLLSHVDAIAAALDEAAGVPLVLLETGGCHGDREFADALQAALGAPVHRMPESPTVEDVVAAIAHSRGFVGISLHGNVVARAYGLPSAILDLGAGYSKLAGFAAVAGCEEALVLEPAWLPDAVRRTLSTRPAAGSLDEVVARIDDHFDRLADLASRNGHGRRLLRDSDETQLRRAFEARGRRIVAQRLRLGEEIVRLEERQAECERKLAAATAELDALRSSSANRLAEPIRRVRRRLRRRQA